jgi:hypothetical protein
VRVSYFDGSKMTKEQNAGAAKLSAFAPTEVMKEGYWV